MRGPTRLARWMAGLVPGAVLLLALLAGALQTAAFAPTQAWWLQPLALALLAALVWEASPRRAAWSGFCFGLGWLASGLW